MRSITSLKSTIINFLGKHSKGGRQAFWLSYVHNRHKLPNFDNPKDLSELWVKRVLDGKINNYSYLADKYAVRDYVKSKGFADILTKVYAVYESSEEIDFDKLPNSFALKANFGAGFNIICCDKTKIDYAATRKQVEIWLKTSSYSYTEKHYDLIPKKFICEEFIDDGSGGFPIDYKFMCLNGKVHCILACSGREKGHADYLPYSIEWEPMFNYYRSYPKDIDILKRPNNLSNMIAVAEKLAEDVDMVRIDLYSNGEKIWFGEITLTPSGCIFHRWSDEAISKMGELYRREQKS